MHQHCIDCIPGELAIQHKMIWVCLIDVTLSGVMCKALNNLHVPVWPLKQLHSSIFSAQKTWLSSEKIHIAQWNGRHRMINPPKFLIKEFTRLRPIQVRPRKDGEAAEVAKQQEDMLIRRIEDGKCSSSEQSAAEKKEVVDHIGIDALRAFLEKLEKKWVLSIISGDLHTKVCKDAHSYLHEYTVLLKQDWDGAGRTRADLAKAQLCI